MSELDPSTLAVTAGREPAAPGAPVSVPVFFASTYHAGGDHIYGRDSNPTWSAFESALGALEGGHAVVFSSGLAAMSAVLSTVPAGGFVVAPAVAYAGTRRMLKEADATGRARVRAVDTTDVDATLHACEGAALLFLESPTNPLMDVADIAVLSEGAHTRGCRVAVDNTFATPILQKPLALGADLVVHSVTKFLAGHSDVVLGAVVTTAREAHDEIAAHRALHGAIAGPMETFLALRGMRTLAVRMERAQASAAEIARRLQDDGRIAVVRYPGFGAVLSFDVRGDAAIADAVCAATRLIVHATSLGGVETQMERRNRWQGEEATPPTLLRLSVGIEHVEDIWSDLDQALASAIG